MDGDNHESNGRLMRGFLTLKVPEVWNFAGVKGSCLSIPVMSTPIDQFMRTIASIIGC